MNINRDYYLNKLINARGIGMIKILTGVRRCGKSYLLFTIFKEWLMNNGVREDHIIAINLENRANKELRDPDNLLAYIHARMIDEATYFVLLDEVQLVSEFVDVLNSLFVQCRDIRDRVQLQVFEQRRGDRVPWQRMGNPPVSVIFQGVHECVPGRQNNRMGAVCPLWRVAANS